jgi:HopA1 effector protein family
MAARLDQAASQVMGGDEKAAKKSLAHITAKEFQAAPKELQQRYKELGKFVEEAASEKSKKAYIKNEVESINRTMTYGDKRTKEDCVGRAYALLHDIQNRYPKDTKAAEDLKLMIAGLQLEAGDAKGAAATAKEVAAKTDDLDVKDQTQMLEAEAAFQDTPPRIDEAVKMFNALAQSGSSNEVCKEAKDRVVSIESDYVNTIGHKASEELNGLKKLERHNFGRLDEGDPPDIIEHHKEALKHLTEVENGTKLAIEVMKKNGFSVADLETMNMDKLAGIPGVGGRENARQLRMVLNMEDMNTIAKGDLQGKHFSWDKGHSYENPDYLDLPDEKALKWIGQQVRNARATDEYLKKSDSWLERQVGKWSGRILDAVSTTDEFVKDKIKIANDFYHQQGGVLGKIGLTATFVAEQATSVVTMPTTIVDPKATDEERKAAITGTLIMVASGGLLKAAGPAFGEALGAAGKAVGRGVAKSRLGQLVADSWVGDAAKWTASKAKGANKWFEGTSVAKGVDKVTDKLGKINRFGKSESPAVGTSGTGETGETNAGKPKAGNNDGADTAKTKETGSTDPDAADTLKMKKGGSGDPDAADTVKIHKAGSSDAADTAKTRKTGANDGTAPGAGGSSPVEGSPNIPPSKGIKEAPDDYIGDRTAGDLQASVTEKAETNMRSKLIDDKWEELFEQKKDELTDLVRQRRAELQRAGLQVPENLTVPDEKEIERLVRNQYSEKDVGQMVDNQFSRDDVRRMVLGNEIYKKAYHGGSLKKTGRITKEEYAEKMASVKGREISPGFWDSPDGKTQIREDGAWQHRLSKVGDQIGLDPAKVQSGQDVRRFYFNVQPDKAGELADYITSELQKKNLKYQFKMGQELKGLNRPDAEVLYVDKADYKAVKDIVMKYAQEHPEAFADGTPAWTKSLGKGVAVAEEPLQAGLPANRGGKHSFGSARSDIIAEAILKAPPNATKDQILALVRERMEHYKLNLDRPWLSGPGPDDL